MNHFVFPCFYFGAKNGSPALGMATRSFSVRRVSPGRVIAVLFWTKYTVPRHIKPGIFKLTTSRGQSNLRTVFIFVSCEEKGCYRIVSLGHPRTPKFWLPLGLQAQPPYARPHCAAKKYENSIWERNLKTQKAETISQDLTEHIAYLFYSQEKSERELNCIFVLSSFCAQTKT